MPLLSGTIIAEEILERVSQDVRMLNVSPKLATVLVGNNTASILYVEKKITAAQKVGITVYNIHLDTNISQKDILHTVTELSKNPTIDGILIQLPLPPHINSRTVIDAVVPHKDVDGLRDDSPYTNAFILALSTMVHAGYRTNLRTVSTKDRVVLIGNSQIFLSKLSASLVTAGFSNITPILGDVYNSSKKIIATADVIITAVGKPWWLRLEYVKKGAMVIDGGIDRTSGNIRGDVCPEGVEDRNITLSPVPGGVGPVTIAMLLFNTVIAVKQKGIQSV